MATIRLLSVSFLLTAIAAAAGAPPAVDDAAKQFAARTADLPAALRIEFQLTGAQALARYPALAHTLLDPVLEEIRSGKTPPLSPGAVRALVAASPDDAMAVLPRLPRGSRETLIRTLLQRNRLADAVRVYRDGLAAGELNVPEVQEIINSLEASDLPHAKELFQQILHALPADPDPWDAWQFLRGADAMEKMDRELGAAAYERILAAASKPDYGKGRMTIKVEYAGFTTDNSRDSLLVAAGSRLLAVAPEKAAAYRDQLSRWDLSQRPAVKRVNYSMPGNHPQPASEVTALSKRMSQLRGNLSDADRARLAIDVAGEIHAMPGGEQKLNLATGLANLSTEGDLGKPALAAVSATLAEALHQCPGTVFDYVELASLVRYEHVPLPAVADPAEKAGEALLALRDQIHQTAGFTLTSLDGKTYSLAGLRGKIVLLNFWATWCPPCRKEMPDMEKLSQTYADQGLVVLAVSDEGREVVAPFIEKQQYTFPVLLDTDDKVHEDFDVEGIPKSFIFDRDGRLAAQAIDMRTASQFMELLKQAGM
jgi:peroxiredoxin